MNVHAQFQPAQNGRPVEIHQVRVVVPQEEREIDINDTSLDASTLWEIIDHMENLMGDSEGQGSAALMARLARQLSRQLDRDLRAFSGALPPSN